MGTDSSKLLDGMLEEGLLAQIAHKDAEAFTRFYTKTSDLLYSVAMSILRDPQIAQDVLQDVYTQVWKQAARFDPELGKPIAWVMTLTRNKALDRLRSSKRRKLMLEELTNAHNSGNPFPSLAYSADTSETVELVRKALQTFPARQQRALELALFEGLTHAEVSKVLNEPLGTVKAWLRRGIIELRNHLGGDL